MLGTDSQSAANTLSVDWPQKRKRNVSNRNFSQLTAYCCSQSGRRRRGSGHEERAYGAEGASAGLRRAPLDLRRAPLELKGCHLNLRAPNIDELRTL